MKILQQNYKPEIFLLRKFSGTENLQQTLFTVFVSFFNVSLLTVSLFDQLTFDFRLEKGLRIRKFDLSSCDDLDYVRFNV